VAKPLTVKAVEAFKPQSARREIPDGLLTGLYLVVQPSGAKSWAVRYRANSTPKKLTLGPWPALDLVAARDLGRKALVKVAEGRDPGMEKKERRRAQASGEQDQRDLVEKVVETFIERHAKAKTREASWRETQRILNKDVVPAWRGRRIQDITRHDVIALLDAVVDRGAPTLANRVLAAVRRMFNWCLERGLLTTSPCLDIKAPSAESSRDRVLSAEELRLIWHACEAIGWPFGPLVQLLMLTGQRRDEVGAMRWSEIDLDRRLWTIPRERVKNDQAHQVPLSDPAMAILRSLPKVGGSAGFVFTTTGTTAVGGFSRAKERLDATTLQTMRNEAAEMGRNPAEVLPLPHWTFHDLRRTAASGMARLGINLPVIEKVLNHNSGSFAGIVGVYQRHSFGDEKRAALEAWGQFVESLLRGEALGEAQPDGQ
jgi:integrase